MQLTMRLRYLERNIYPERKFVKTYRSANTFSNSYRYQQVLKKAIKNYGEDYYKIEFIFDAGSPVDLALYHLFNVDESNVEKFLDMIDESDEMKKIKIYCIKSSGLWITVHDYNEQLKALEISFPQIQDRTDCLRLYFNKKFDDPELVDYYYDVLDLSKFYGELDKRFSEFQNITGLRYFIINKKS